MYPVVLLQTPQPVLSYASIIRSRMFWDYVCGEMFSDLAETNSCVCANSRLFVTLSFCEIFQ